MKKLPVVAFALAGIVAAVPASAEPANQAGPICIHFDNAPDDAIDHTHVIDPTTILFYLRSGAVLKNTLKEPCPGLLLHGFTFVTPMNEICSNSQGIRVLESGEVCQLGTFAPYDQPQH